MIADEPLDEGASHFTVAVACPATACTVRGAVGTFFAAAPAGATSAKEKARTTRLIRGTRPQRTCCISHNPSLHKYFLTNESNGKISRMISKLQDWAISHSPLRRSTEISQILEQVWVQTSLRARRGCAKRRLAMTVDRRDLHQKADEDFLPGSVHLAKFDDSLSMAVAVAVAVAGTERRKCRGSGSGRRRGRRCNR